MYKRVWVLAAGFILVTLPGAVDSWLSLYDRIQGSDAKMTINFASPSDLYRLFFPILGLAILFWGAWWTRPTKELAKRKEIAAKAPSGSDDALEHVVVLGRTHVNLAIHRGRGGWPVMYPLTLRNTRPLIVDIIGYNVSVMWGVMPVQKIEWRAPNRYATNDLAVAPPFDSQEPWEAFRLQPDQPYELSVPVLLSKIPHWPTASPQWGASGTLYLRCGDAVYERQFNNRTDNYQLTLNEWSDLRMNAAPR